jgi:RND family efflux transporter MFP subunit
VVDIALVTSVLAKKKPFKHYFQVQGVVASKKNIILTPETGGMITNVLVEEGQKVTSGDLIATFSTSIINSTIEELEQQLELAKYYYEKQQSLKEQGVGTDLSLKEASANYNRLLKNKNTLLAQKNKFSLYAPFTGYIDKLFVTIGQSISPATPIIRLVSLNHMYVSANISENYLAKINNGQFVEIELPALNEKIEGLKIKNFSKQIDPVNRTLSIEVPIPSKDKIIPNLMAVLNICDYQTDSSIVVPSSLILENNRGEHVVKIIKGGVVKEKKVTIGKQYNNQTELIEGIISGEKIIDKGKKNVVTGQKVNLLNN